MNHPGFFSHEKFGIFCATGRPQGSPGYKTLCHPRCINHENQGLVDDTRTKSCIEKFIDLLFQIPEYRFITPPSG